MCKNFAANKLKLSRNKSTIAIAFVLVLTITVTTIALPVANAHDPPWTIPTNAYLSVAPNPAGVGQTVSVSFWLDKPPPTASGKVYGDRYQFTVIVTKPNGANETLGPFTCNNVGGASTSYVPGTVGNYTFVMEFPGLKIVGANPPPPDWGRMGMQFIGDYFEPSTSDPVTLVVQEEPIQYSPSTPLPTSYWEYPVYGTNWEWSTISGNWLGFGVTDFEITGHYNATGNFNPYTTAPNTAHIVWTTPYALGGQIGGEFEGDGKHLYYNGYFPPTWQPIIINGILYTNWQTETSGIHGFKAIDLYTGEELWFHDSTASYQQNAFERLRCGQTLYFNRGEGFGMVAYLWTWTGTEYGLSGGMAAELGKYSMYDANTGRWILDIVDAPDSTGWGGRQGTSLLMEDENGNLIMYYVNKTYAIPGNPFSPVVAASLAMWNSTLCIDKFHTFLTTSETTMRFWSPPQGASIPFSYGIQWSIPLPTEISGVPIDPALDVYTLGSSDVVICSSNPGLMYQGYPPGVIDVGYDALTGQLLWGPTNRTAEAREFLCVGCSGDGIYTTFTRATRTWTAYSLTTGEKVWDSPPIPDNAWNAWSSYGVYTEIAYGNMYAWDYGGNVYCLNAKTGKLIWSWNTGSSGYDTPWGKWPFPGPYTTIADGKIYLPAGHLITPPYYKGAQTYCLNATTGELMWSVSGWNCFAPPAISGGYMLMCNAYDNQIYCFNKGPTAVTVKAPDTYQPLGKQVLVTGTVMDVSPGTEQDAQTARFPNGVPAIADEDMSAWMEYVYMQQVMPTNAKGVEVVVSVLDSNNNYYEVGRTTSDTTGFYSLSFTPEVPGKYTIVASFAGSESYFGSLAKTGLGVEEAVSATPEPTQAPASLADQYVLPGIVGTIAAIAVVGALMLLQLRRK